MEIGNLELSAFNQEHNAKTYCHKLVTDTKMQQPETASCKT
jgi:hypothetical protein